MLKKPYLRSKIWCCQWGPWSCRTCQRWCPAQCWLGLHVQQRQGEGEGEGFWQDCSWFAEPGVCLWHSLKLGRKLWACTRDHQRLLGGGGFASGAPAYTRAGAVEAELLSDNPQWSNSSKAMLRGGFKGETGQIPTWAELWTSQGWNRIRLHFAFWRVYHIISKEWTEDINAHIWFDESPATRDVTRWPGVEMFTKSKSQCLLNPSDLVSF